MSSRSDRMDRSAVFSPDRVYRYRLTRRWGDGRALPFVMLNPSIGGEVDDPTVRRCVGRGRHLGYDAIEIVNLFAYVATDPADLRGAGWPVGPDNDMHIEAVCRGASHAVCAWGNHAKGLARPIAVLAMLKAWGVKPMALQINSGGAPAHPVRLPYRRKLLEL